MCASTPGFDFKSERGYDTAHITLQAFITRFDFDKDVEFDV
jgi:hypothetical protein